MEKQDLEKLSKSIQFNDIFEEYKKNYWQILTNHCIPEYRDSKHKKELMEILVRLLIVNDYKAIMDGKFLIKPE